MVDPALVRPGRFDKIVSIPLPDKVARLQIVTLNLEGKQKDKDVNLDSTGWWT
jgi:SpoVK/Ycf46/Vps4 family AAA+-type ATPase